LGTQILGRVTFEHAERRKKLREATDDEKRKRLEAAARINLFVETTFVRQKVFGERG